MTGASPDWNPAQADWSPSIADWESASPPTSGGSRRPMRLTLDLTPQDDEDEALLIAFLRHRLRL